MASALDYADATASCADTILCESVLGLAWRSFIAIAVILQMYYFAVIWKFPAAQIAAYSGHDSRSRFARFTPLMIAEGSGA